MLVISGGSRISQMGDAHPSCPQDLPLVIIVGNLHRNVLAPQCCSMNQCYPHLDVLYVPVLLTSGGGGDLRLNASVEKGQHASVLENSTLQCYPWMPQCCPCFNVLHASLVLTSGGRDPCLLS